MTAPPAMEDEASSMDVSHADANVVEPIDSGSTEGELLLNGRGIGSTLSASVGLQICILISGSLIARQLGVDKRGVLAAIMLWPAVLSGLGDLGGPIAYVYQSATHPTLRRQLAVNSVWLTLSQTAILFLVGVPVVWYTMDRDSASIGLALAFLVLFLSTDLQFRYLNSLRQGSGYYGAFNIARLMGPAIYAASAIFLYVCGNHSLKWVVLALALDSIGALLLVLIPWIAVFRSSSLRPDKPLLKETLSYGLRAHLGNLTPVDSLRLDLALIVLLLPPKEAGLYTVAVAGASVVRHHGGTLGYVAMPSVAASRTTEEKGKTVGLFFRLSVLLNGGIALFVILASRPLVNLVYGSAYGGAVPLLRVLAIGLTFASLRQTLGDCLRGAGQPLSSTLAEISGIAVLVPTLALLLPPYSAMGAACAVLTSYFVSLLVSVSYVRKLNMSTLELVLPRWSDLKFVKSAIQLYLPSRLPTNLKSIYSRCQQ